EDAATHAFERREHVSELERYIVDVTYYENALGDQESVIETARSWARAYPRDARPHIYLSGSYEQLGQSPKAIVETDEAIRLDPNLVSGYVTKGFSLIRNNRFDEAKEVFNLALAKGLDSRFV